jgi:outer membrane protein assembly factor BamB
MFRGIRVTDGEEVFSVPAGAYTAASPTTNGNRAYFGTFDNEVVGLDLSSQDVLWRYEHPKRHFPFYSSALSVDGKVVIGGRDRMVHAIDETSGESLWTFMTQARIDSSPAAAGKRVYIGSGDGRLYVLDLDTGEKLWDFDTGSPLAASPAIASGKLVIGSQDGVLYCFG